jgi:methionyl-tRNA synthetase
MGKDNITFHTVMWPSILLGYKTGGELGAGKAPLELPDDIVASEYLTMEGKKFATSRGVGIYVSDFLSRYDPDPLRYYLVAAGPETHDSEFTWAEFVRRNNDELLANWGNLVNRALTVAQRNFGGIPEPGEPAAADQAVLDAVAGGFETVGAQIEAAHMRAALGEVMALASQVNQYVSEQKPWDLVKTDRDRAATVLYTALRAVNDLRTLFAPFLPFSSQRVHELLGNEGTLAGPLEFREIDEGEGERHFVLTGDYAPWVGEWAPAELPAGRPLEPPTPLFRKLDPSVADEEVERMRPPE